MIGIFDSGSGGLTILKALVRSFPNQSFTYLGDHSNAPYGHRENSDIVKLTRTGVETLMNSGCRLVILACNTAAAVALRTLQQGWLAETHPDNRVLGVLVPTVEAMTGVPWHIEEPYTDIHHRTEKILIFATQKTVESGAYVDEVRKRLPNAEIRQTPCPGLVAALEQGADAAEIKTRIDGYVADGIGADGWAAPDAVLLGCTHFPLAEMAFRAALPAATPLYSQPVIVAESLADYLHRHPEFNGGKAPGTVRLLTTGEPGGVNLRPEWLPVGNSATPPKFDHI